MVDNKQNLKDLAEAKKKADDALEEIAQLRKELAEAKSDADQLRLTKAYNKETDVLSATDWFQKGYNAYENKEYDKAISFYLRAIELDPDDDAAYVNLGVAYYYQGNYTKAKESYERAIELDPDEALAYQKIGDLYMLQINLIKAIELYEKVIELDPDNAFVIHTLGLVYSILGKPELKPLYYKKAAKLGHQPSQDWLKENGYDW